jgi:hypothetical protein
MLDKLEFSDSKQVRKTLLIISFSGILFNSLVENATGNIEFFGFKIPIADASLIPNFIGYLVIYFIITLIIRYFDEDFRTKYKSYIERYITNNAEILNQNAIERAQEVFQSKIGFHQFISKGVFFIDIIFPVLFGLFSLYIIFLT